MKNIWILTFLLLCFISQVDAQIRLRTPEGKFVLLFDNGTWKYEEEKKIDQTTNPGTTGTPINVEAELPAVLHLKNVELEKHTVIKGNSAKLDKFMDEENTVKCDFQLLSTEAKLILKTSWKIMDEEGFRFFGYITKRSKIVLELSNNEIISLNYATDFAPKEYPKYGFTIFDAELELTDDQIRKLQTGYIVKAEMIWSRRTETYSVFDPDYFLKELPKTLE